MNKLNCNLLCSKTLPTAYSNSLSYYEEICKLHDKINEIIEYLEKHDCNCKPSVVTNTSLPDEVRVEVYARTAYNDYYAQGMCIIKINGCDYIVQGMIKDNSNQYICIKNAKNGEIYSEKNFTDLGHCNSICSDGCHIYVATGGGGSLVYDIIKLDFSLNVIASYTLGENINPYAITYNKGNFYIFGKNNLCWVTKDFINYNDILSVPNRKNVVYQGATSDNNYIFLIRGNWYSNFSQNNSCVNIVDVFDYNMKLVKTINIIAYTELEEFDFLCDGSIIISSSTIKSAVYLKGNIYSTTVNIKGDNNRYNNGMVLNSFNYDVYVDELTKNFKQDGTKEYPFSSFFMLINSQPFYISNISLHLLSDISLTFTLHGRIMNYLRIYGDGHTITGNINVENSCRLYLNNVTIKGANEKKYCLDVNFGCNIYSINTTLDLSNSIGGIRLQGSVGQFENLTLKNCSKKLNIYSINGGGIRFLSGLTDDGGYYNLQSIAYGEPSSCTPSKNSLLSTGTEKHNIMVLNNLLNFSNKFEISDINYLCVSGDFVVKGLDNMPSGYAGEFYKIRRVNDNVLKCTLSNNTNKYYVRYITVANGEKPTNISEWVEHNN